MDFYPVDQTKFGADEGNCLMACVASLFRARIEDLPELTNDHNDGSWYDILRGAVHRWQYTVAHVPNDTPVLPRGTHLAMGVSDRNLPHVVVMRDGEVLHDPHPSRSGLSRVTSWLIFVPLV